MPEAWVSIRNLLTAYATVAIVAGIPVAILAKYRKRHAVPLLPKLDGWKVPWSGMEVAFGFLLFVLIPLLLSPLLTQSGFFQWWLGPDVTLTPTEEGTLSPEQKHARTIASLWISVLAFPLFVMGVIWIVRQSGRQALSMLGSPSHRITSDLVSGYATWTVLTPVVFFVFGITLLTLWSVAGREPDQHPLTSLGGLHPVEGILLGVEITLAAPVSEELLFRGLLLPVLLSNLVASRFCFIVAILSAAFFNFSEIQEALSAGHSGDILWAGGSVIFVLLVAPFFFAIPRRWGPVLPAIVASAMLFGAFHSAIWPTPIPLFVLGLGLGWLTWRTRSVVGAIVVHSLFNSVTGVLLLLGGPN